MKDRNKIFEFNNIVIDFSTRTVKKNDQVIDLTSKEIDILKTLLDNPNREFSKKQVYLVVWG